jgi:DNA-binding beta-propeller fold protein YncE
MGVVPGSFMLRYLSMNGANLGLNRRPFALMYRRANPGCSNMKWWVPVLVLGLLLCLGPRGVLAAGPASTAPLKLAASLYGDEGTGPFGLPMGVAVSGRDLAVADTGNKRLLLFEVGEGKAPGELTFKPAGEFNAGGKMGAPYCIGWLPGGRLLVGERGKNDLMVFDPKGDPKSGSYGPAGLKATSGEPLPTLTGRFRTDSSGGLCLIDETNRRILLFGPGLGAAQREIRPQDSGFTGFRDVAVDEGGNVYALESLAGRVWVFDKQGKEVRRFGKRGQDPGEFDLPSGLAVDRKGSVYVLDGNRGSVQVYTREGRHSFSLGSRGAKEGELDQPSGLAVDGAMRLFVADRLNGRVQVFTPLRPM